MKTCFSIMPFGEDFKDIDDIIRASAEECGLEYVRGDLNDKPGSVMRQILHEIKRAAVVVADMTGHNPSVFYELGIAHQIMGLERVVIVTQALDGRKPTGSISSGGWFPRTTRRGEWSFERLFRNSSSRRRSRTLLKNSGTLSGAFCQGRGCWCAIWRDSSTMQKGRMALACRPFVCQSG